MKQNFYQVPPHVSSFEAATLYDYMATGEPYKHKFLDKRNQVIFNELENQLRFARIGTCQFINRLIEAGKIEAAGGADYVKKVFGNLEPAEAVY